MKESTIEKAVNKHARALGWWCSKFTGTPGCPDRLYIKDGEVVFIEFKATSKKPRPLQVAIIKKMTDHGAIVHVIDNIEEGKGVFNAKP